MDPERTPEEAVGDRQASSRPAPEPRSADSRADDRATGTRGGDPRHGGGRSPDRRTAELRSGELRHAADARADPHTGDFRVGESRPTSADPTVPTNIYRARRPAVAVLLVLPAVGVGLLLVRALAISAFGNPFLIGGVIASSLALASLPLIVGGLYGLVTGAAHGAEQWGFKVWARPPLAYLVVGIAFVLAAGLAIR